MNSSHAEVPARELLLAERAADVRDAVDLIRRAATGVQSQRAAELVDLAEQQASVSVSSEGRS